MDGGLLPPWVPVAEQGVLGLVPAVVGLPGASVELTQPRHQLGSGGFEGSPSQARELWSLLPQQREGFSSSHADEKLLLPLHSSFCPARGLACAPPANFQGLPWVPLSPPCCVWDLYLILIYFFIGLSLSLLLFPALLSSRFALQRAAGWL